MKILRTLKLRLRRLRRRFRSLQQRLNSKGSVKVVQVQVGHSLQSQHSVQIEFRNVYKEYADKRNECTRVLDDINISLRRGAFVALIGEAGCGKTTLLRLVNGLERPTRGQIFVRGRSVQSYRLEELRRGIGYVIQESGLFPHLTVSENVATVPRLLGWSKDQVRQRVREVLELVRLPEEDFGARFPNQLSGGQRQRAGVARGLAGRPDILLMDEPFGALDPATRTNVQEEFLRIQKASEMTVVLVTHDMVEAGRLADEIVLLGGRDSPWRGQVLQQGSLRDILVTPNEKVRRGSSLAGGGAGGMAREALLLRCVLPFVQSLSDVPDPRPTLPILSCDDPLGQALLVLENVKPGQPVAVGSQWYDAYTLRRQILEDLIKAETAFARS